MFHRNSYKSCHSKTDNKTANSGCPENKFKSRIWSGFILAVMVCSSLYPVQAADGSFQKTDEGTTWVEDGVVQTSKWIKQDGCWYWFNEQGLMQTGWAKIDDEWYYFSEEGVMQKGWLQLGDDYYYLNQNGTMATGMRTIGGKTYYFLTSGRMAKSRWVNFAGIENYFTTSGAMAASRWINWNGKSYYVNADGEMETSTWITDGNKQFYVDEKGVWTKTRSLWSRTLANYLDKNYADSAKCSLINLTSDQTSCAVVKNGSYIDLLVVDNDEVKCFQFTGSGFWYVPESDQLDIRETASSSQIDSLGEIQNGELVMSKVLIKSGSYYTINGASVSSGKYSYTLRNEYDSADEKWAEPASTVSAVLKELRSN